MFLFTRINQLSISFVFIVNYLFLIQVCHFNGIIMVVFCSCSILEDIFILFTGNLQHVIFCLCSKVHIMDVKICAFPKNMHNSSSHRKF